MEFEHVPFTEVLAGIVDNRGKTCPTAADGLPLIATNCIRNERLYPSKEKVRYVDNETYENWFRGHPEPGDIIFVTKGSPGRVCMTPDPVDFCIAQDMVAVRADPAKIDPNYLFAVLRSHNVQVQIDNMHVGTMIPHFKKGDFNKLMLPIPNRTAQEFIGNQYRILSDKIELNRRMNATLESLARAIFKSWFVDFDPVRSKSGQQAEPPSGPGAATATSPPPRDLSPDSSPAYSPFTLPPSLSALFPSTFQDSDLGKIPEGWEAKTTADVLSDDRGISVGVMYPGKHDPTGVPLIKAGDLSDGVINRSPQFRITPAKHEEYRRTEFSGGEILMTLVGNIGQCAVVPAEMKGWNSARAVAVIRLADPENADYCRLWFESPPTQFLMHAWANTTVQPTLNLKEIRKLPLLWPPKDVREAFGELVAPICERANENQRESLTLSTLRDTLLPKLLSGELPVPAALTATDKALA